MIVLLLIWLVLLTVLVIVGFLAILGKVSFLSRGFYKNLENLEGVFALSQTDFKNLKTSFENLQKTSQYDNSTLAGSMEQIENRIAQLQETQEKLRADLDRGYEERPITAELAAIPRNRGGRPRKEPTHEQTH